MKVLIKFSGVPWSVHDQILHDRGRGVQSDRVHVRDHFRGRGRAHDRDHGERV